MLDIAVDLVTQTHKPIRTPTNFRALSLTFPQGRAFRRFIFPWFFCGILRLGLLRVPSAAPRPSLKGLGSFAPPTLKNTTKTTLLAECWG